VEFSGSEKEGNELSSDNDDSGESENSENQSDDESEKISEKVRDIKITNL
jgi:hypothetical protein